MAGNSRRNKQRFFVNVSETGERVPRFLDDDVDMERSNGAPGNRQRFNPYKHGKGSKNSKPSYTITESPSGWYKVTLYNATRYPRFEIFKTLQNYLKNVSLAPSGVRSEGEDLIFFVDEQKEAAALRNASIRIEMKNGYKLQIKVQPHIPVIEVNAGVMEHVKQAMSARYNVQLGELNLKKFHADEYLNKKEIFFPLNRPNSLKAVFQIISQSIPNIVCLNLSHNKIYTTEHFAFLKQGSPRLKKLNLTYNKIKDLSMLKCLEGMQLEELHVDFNPMCDKYIQRSLYVKDIRNIFKTLLKLDGVDLPPPVLFDVEENRDYPEERPVYLCDERGAEFTYNFLQTFYQMYDNQNGRGALREAYAQEAQFSMSCFYMPGGCQTLARYMSESRNLLKVNSVERRSKFLKVGRENVVEYLNTMPKTKHYLSTFHLDLSVYTPEFISISTNGLFSETGYPENEYKQHVRRFTRMFVLVPSPDGNGYKISNDMLCITTCPERVINMASNIFTGAPDQLPPPRLPATMGQAVSIIEADVGLMSLSGPSPSTSGVNVASTSAVANDEAAKKGEMVAAVCAQTGMNASWSEKCLSETNWDFNTALYAFNEFKNRGSIPPEAFMK